MGAKILRFVIALVIVTGLSGFGLAKVFLLTKPMIDEQEKIAKESAKKIIFPTATEFVKKEASDVKYEIAKKDGKKIGILFVAEKSGYSSVLKTLVGLDNSNKINGIVILNQKETPGLGARMQEIKSDKYIWTFWKTDKNTGARPWFQKMFVGLDPSKLHLTKGTEWKDLSDKKKEEYRKESMITALSGATISTNACMTSILEAYKKVSGVLKKSESTEKKVEAEVVDSSIVDTTISSIDSTKIDSVKTTFKDSVVLGAKK